MIWKKLFESRFFIVLLLKNVNKRLNRLQKEIKNVLHTGMYISWRIFKFHHRIVTPRVPIYRTRQEKWVQILCAQISKPKKIPIITFLSSSHELTTVSNKTFPLAVALLRQKKRSSILKICFIRFRSPSSDKIDMRPREKKFLYKQQRSFRIGYGIITHTVYHSASIIFGVHYQLSMKLKGSAVTNGISKKERIFRIDPRLTEFCTKIQITCICWNNATAVND